MRARLAPIVEGLEDRRLLSGTVNVSTTNDVVDGTDTSIAALIANPGPDGKISLREAIIAANNTAATNGSPNTVNVPSGTYTLTKGELDVTNNLTIAGAGAGSTIIEAGTSLATSDGKIFSFNPFNDNTGAPTVSAGFAVSLSGATLQFGKNLDLFTTDNGGHSEGGAFDFDAGLDGGGSLSLNNVVITNNETTAGDGGGIALFDGGTISITGSVISNNIATGTMLGGGGSGGGIYIGDNFTNATTVTISTTTITGNKTTGNAAGSGGGLISFPGIDGSGDASNSVALHADTITSNTSAAGQDGGGVDIYGGLTVDQGTAINGNSSGRWGGGLFLSGTATITNTTIVGNSASGGAGPTANEGGGGIFANNSSSNLTVTDSRIVGNTATVGGSQLDGNGGSSGGGILNAANNWFGINTLSSSFFGVGVKTLTTTPFLKETFTTPVTTLAGGASATLTASITTNSNNQTGFFVPNGTPATFSGGTIGSVNPSSTSTTSGTATSTFTAGSTPGKGNVSATIDNQTLNIQLTIVGTPIANAQSVNVAHNTAKAITLTGSDPDTPPLSLTFAVVTNPSHGTLTGTAPNLTYTPTAGYQGADSFTFTVSNGTSISTAATVSITVAAGTPTAIAQSVSVGFNTAKSITLTGTDPDVPALSLTFSIATNPSHGTLTGTAPNLTYTPTAGYHGTDSFTFTVNNGANISSPATVSITVAAGTPTANSQVVNVNENTAAGITLTGTDPDIPPLSLTYAVATNPAHGTLSGTAPNLTYTPNANYSGPDTFTFTVSNGTNISTAATVSINVAQGTATIGGDVGITWGTSGTATLQTNADGLRLLSSGRSTDLDWLGINTLQITLSQAETLSASDVSVTGVNIANYGPVTISGSGTNYTITLSQPINAADRVTVTIGNANIATFTRRLDVLPGDFNDDGVVNAQDATLVRNEYLSLGGAMPLVTGDINGDGIVDVNDYNTVRRLIGTRLP
jgi:Bacterial Ig domain/Dockerin type I domain